MDETAMLRTPPADGSQNRETVLRRGQLAFARPMASCAVPSHLNALPGFHDFISLPLALHSLRFLSRPGSSTRGQLLLLPCSGHGFPAAQRLLLPGEVQDTQLPSGGILLPPLDIAVGPAHSLTAP